MLRFRSRGYRLSRGLALPTLIRTIGVRRGSTESFTRFNLPPSHSSVWAFLPLRKSSTTRSSRGGIRGSCGFRVWPDLTLPDSGFSPSSVRCRQTPLRDADRQACAHPSRQLCREAQFAEAPESQRTYTPLHFHKLSFGSTRTFSGLVPETTGDSS